MIVAVLEAHAGLKLGQHDIYLTVAGGLRVNEPAADLAAAAALVSSLCGRALPSDVVFFGEVGLSGAVRPVAHAAARLKEAAKLGFTRAVAPRIDAGVEGPRAARLRACRRACGTHRGAVGRGAPGRRGRAEAAGRRRAGAAASLPEARCGQPAQRVTGAATFAIDLPAQ